MTFFQFQLGMGYGVRKMTARLWRVFLLLRVTLPDPYLPRYGPLCRSKWPKIIKIFCFRVYDIGFPIEWSHGGDHFWYSERLVNSAISGSNWADRPRIVGKFSLLPLQILSFAQGRKNWSPAPQWAACGSWGVGDHFFDRPGLRASHTQTIKNEEPSRAPLENALAFYKLSFFLISSSFGFGFYLFHFHSYPFSESIPHLWPTTLISENINLKQK